MSIRCFEVAVYRSLSDRRLLQNPAGTRVTLASAWVEDARVIAAPLPVDSLTEVSSVELGHESTGFVCHKYSPTPCPQGSMGRIREMSISLMARGVLAVVNGTITHEDTKDIKEDTKAASSSSSIMSNLPDGYVVHHFSRYAANNRPKPSKVVASFEAGGIQDKPTDPQGMDHTSFSALTGTMSFGPLQGWQNFLLDVHDFYVNQPSSRKNADCRLASSDVHEERVFVGDGKGLQGRFQQSVGQVVGAVLEAQQRPIAFADFKAVGLPYAGVPDFDLMCTNTSSPQAQSWERAESPLEE
ncbi:hypothetical protein N7519_010102 [Penicillium mononematosum]|uniref:uncharacterized protein n=1 Tax=Penicillium mononematosum TaxID=268346 RepID=UPI002549AE74|nr:uncharacterized protein N7519_010102 [Penicillium mononematosum]KAJ6179641.1 hypothetical protein N7519_010102 [Penicillium mononematosum]